MKKQDKNSTIIELKKDIEKLKEDIENKEKTLVELLKQLDEIETCEKNN